MLNLINKLIPPIFANMILVLIIVFVTLLFVSCQNENTRQVYNEDNKLPMSVKTKEYSYDVSEWEHKGHLYLIVERAHGSGITHAGHCPCNTRK